jgi:hypothetical protein
VLVNVNVNVNVNAHVPGKIVHVAHASIDNA